MNPHDLHNPHKLLLALPSDWTSCSAARACPVLCVRTASQPKLDRSRGRGGSHQWGVRRAFTLMEVLIAISLLVLLGGAMFG
ncbi:MAG: prepilin-type N-terminal cleavage/methylation domain-containing protein, partial [Phycisphaerales bacterium JB038]